MKHTMKKLLCMALAIMLLVSAVPVFAAASSTDRQVVVTFVDQEGATVDTWSYNADDIGEPNWDNAASAAAWAVEQKFGSPDHFDNVVFIGQTDNGFAATIKVWNNAAPPADNPPADNPPADNPPADVPPANEPERAVVVTFRIPGGKTKTWTYLPSEYATADNNNGAPVWNEGAAEWAMNEAVKEQVLSKNYDNATLISVSADSYAATIELSDNAPATSDPTTPSTPTEPATGKITVTIKIGTTVKVDAKTYNAESATINELIRNWNSNWYDDCMLTSYKVGGTTVSAPKTSDVIYAGQTVTINLSKREKEALHDKLSNLKPVILHVYLNNNFNAEDAHYTITSIAEDGTLDLNNDVKNFLKGYYTAKTSDGITYDGMYVADGYFGVKYLADEKYVVLGNDADETGNTTLDRMRSEGYVHLNVMLTNAKAKSSSSSSTADSSNPKTGDTIFVPVMVMGVTATALAAAYVFGKKRFAR